MEHPAEGEFFGPEQFAREGRATSGIGSKRSSHNFVGATTVAPWPILDSDATRSTVLTLAPRAIHGGSYGPPQ
jgi:hypothetical protein